MAVRLVAVIVAAVVVASVTATGVSESDDGPDRLSRAFSFSAIDSEGRPARWDPCQEVRLAFNRANAPAGARRQLVTAAAVIGRSTGLTIRIVSTAAAPSGTYGSQEVAGRWPDVLVAFVRPGDRLLSDRGSSAETTSIRVSGADGGERYVSGSILVNASQNDLYGDGSGGELSRVRLFEHELAHLVGLSHVSDRASVMNPVILRRTGLTPGDRRGLRILGRSSNRDAPCPNETGSGAHPNGVVDKVGRGDPPA